MQDVINKLVSAVDTPYIVIAPQHSPILVSNTQFVSSTAVDVNPPMLNCIVSAAPNTFVP